MVERRCIQCGRAFVPHGGQMYCCKKCRIIQNRILRPMGKREEARINRALSYFRKCIDKTEKDNKCFDFIQCTKCFNTFAVLNNRTFFINIKCPFCLSSTEHSSSQNHRYEVIDKQIKGVDYEN